MTDYSNTDSYVTDIMKGKLNEVKLYDSSIINEVGRLIGIGYDLTPIMSALLFLENDKGTEILQYLLNTPSVNVSKVVSHNSSHSETPNEIHTVFHMICSDLNTPTNICEMILEHSSVDINVLNFLDHNNYRPLDYADKYNPNIVQLLENKGALRYKQVDPKFTPNYKFA